MKAHKKLMNFIHQTRTKYALQGRYVMTISLVGVVTLLITLSRFAYIPFIGDLDIKGSFLKFKWLSSFLYTFGVELGFLGSGFLLYHAGRQLEPSIGKVYIVASHVIASIACFFMAWIFIEQKYFNTLTEIIISSLIGIASAFACFYIQKKTITLLTRLRSSLANVIDALVEKAPKYMEPNKVDQYDEEVVWKTIKEVADEIGGKE